MFIDQEMSDDILLNNSSSCKNLSLISKQIELNSDVNSTKLIDNLVENITVNLKNK